MIESTMEVEAASACDKRQESIVEQLEFLNSKMEKQILLKEAQIDRLFDELTPYKKEAASQFEDQLLRAVVKIRLVMKRNLADEKFSRKSAEELLDAYRYVFEDITDMLELQNCDEFSSAPGADFDPAIHLAKIEETDLPEQDKKVKISLSPGIRKKNKTLVSERVIVYRYTNS